MSFWGIPDFVTEENSSSAILFIDEAQAFFFEVAEMIDHEDHALEQDFQQGNEVLWHLEQNRLQRLRVRDQRI
jgi:hypothetical protein